MKAKANHKSYCFDILKYYALGRLAKGKMLSEANNQNFSHFGNLASLLQITTE